MAILCNKHGLEYVFDSDTWRCLECKKEKELKDNHKSVDPQDVGEGSGGSATISGMG